MTKREEYVFVAEISTEYKIKTLGDLMSSIEKMKDQNCKSREIAFSLLKLTIL